MGFIYIIYSIHNNNISTFLVFFNQRISSYWNFRKHSIPFVPGQSLPALSGEVETLRETALTEKIVFQSGDQSVQQKIALVNQADEGVGRDFGRRTLNQISIGPIVPIGPIDPSSDLEYSGIILVPQRQDSLSQEVLVIQQQLLLAGPGDVDQLQLDFT